jgi:4-hydroxyproline epimerase
VHESIIDSTFTGRIGKEVVIDNRPAIKPSIEGWAKVYGYDTISIIKNATLQLTDFK